MSGGIGAQLTQGGGISPFQQAFADYTFGENIAKANSAYGGSTPISTMKTQADTGAYANKALQMGEMSDADAAAMQAFFNSQAGNLFGGLGTLLGGIGK
jgi:hypothetical protein